MANLPATERLLLGPGPSVMSPRVMRALAAPMLSHLDPDFVILMDEVREGLRRVFRADEKSLTIAMSGTGTSAMEAAVANTVADGTRVTVVVTGYFGERLAHISERYGGKVSRVQVEWGRACDPQVLRETLKKEGADVVAFVHAETSTGVRNPARELAAVAREQGALTIADMVTSLGGHEVELEKWGIDVAYSCTQKCIGAPSGMAPIAVSGPARARLVPCRSFYLDLKLLEEFWVERKYHHTMSASLVYALREALQIVHEEGLEERWLRHERNHRAFAAGLAAMKLELLPPDGERLWTLNAVKAPEGIAEGYVRKMLLETFNMEIGGGLGPLAGKIWRIGLMGAGSSAQSLVLLLGALDAAITRHGFRASKGAGVAAATAALLGEPFATT